MHDDLPFLDLQSPAYRENPDKVLAELRAKSWIARTQEGYELLTYDKCEQILRDSNWLPAIHEIIASLDAERKIFKERTALQLLTAEGSDHDRARRAVMPFFSVHRAHLMRTKTHDMIASLIDAVTPRGQCEFLDEVADKIPSRVFCWMVGAPEEDADQISEWSKDAMSIFKRDKNALGKVQAALKGLNAYCRDLVTKKRQDPGDDLTTFLLKAVDDGTIEERDVPSLINEVLGGSSDNTIQAACLVIWLFCRFPKEWQKLKGQPALVPSAIEECFRFAPRIRRDMFFNAEPVTFAGLEFPAKTHIYASFAAANRDPTIYQNPDVFDITRVHNRSQILFGAGRHHCIGASIVRMELQELLSVVLERWKSMRFNGEVTIHYGGGDMGLPSLPIAFEAERRH